MTLICEICGTRFNEHLTFVNEKWTCDKCAKPLIRKNDDIEYTKDHPNWCSCHACQRMSEYGFLKLVGGGWELFKETKIEKINVICKSAREDSCLHTCPHAKIHIKHDVCGCNNRAIGCIRTIGCENI